MSQPEAVRDDDLVVTCEHFLQHGVLNLSGTADPLPKIISYILIEQNTN
jgi:hypothetical protein